MSKRSRNSGEFEITPFHMNPLKDANNDWEISFLNSYQITDDTSDNTQQSNNDLDDDKPRKKKKLLQETDLSNNYDVGNDNRVVLLKPDDVQYFYGMSKLTVLHGTVDIFGYSVGENSPVNVYSFRGHSLLYLLNITKTTNKKTVISKINNKKLPKPIIIEDNTAVVLCEKLQKANINFIIKHISQQIVPPQQQIIFQPQGEWNSLTFDMDWYNMIEAFRIKKSLKLMVCGGKGTGKSTFLRYMINYLLNKYDKIQIIDLDPGQSEFTVPGCVSIITINKPIFGINFTHLQTTELSLLTQINIHHECENYLNTIENLLQYEFDKNLPILVNTMGYTHDIGLNILSALICVVKPTHIVQINSRYYKKNFRHRLDLGTIQKNATLFLKNVEIDFSYNLHEITTMTDYNRGWQFESRQIREMTILSYFGNIIDMNTNSIYTDNVPLFTIDLRNINITDLNGNQLHPGVINANIVALCSKEQSNTNEKEQIIYRCYGWGIVRGVDIEANNLVLLTPENLQILENVNYLVCNGLTLPPSIYMTPDDIEGDIPYVNSGNLLDLGQLTKRSIVPFNKL